MKILINPHRAPDYPPELARQLRHSFRGMAHFAATGPFGTTCGACAHYGIDVRNTNGELKRRKACGKYRQLTGVAGPSIPPRTESCRHFEPRSK